MKKRILSLLLACAMLFGVMLTVSSCGDESRINKALEKSRTLDCLDAYLFLNLDVEVNDRESTGKFDKNGNPEYTESWDSDEYQMEYRILEAILEDGGVMAEQKGGWLDDESYHYSTYFDTEYAYLPNKTKQALGEYKKYNAYYADIVRALMSELPSEIFVEDDDGNKMVRLEERSGITYITESFNVKNKEERLAFEAIFSDLLSIITTRASEYMECSLCRTGKKLCTVCGNKVEDCDDCATMRTACENCKISEIEFVGDCEIERKLENGYITESMIKFDLEINVGEDRLYIDGSMKALINNPGSELGIKLPENYEKYPIVAVNTRPTILDILN